jgi:hypothetical protein
LGADEECNGEYCQPPSAAQMALFVQEKVVGFHWGGGILTLPISDRVVTEGEAVTT